MSVRKHRWVNRGFMHGPMLPIYGSGAIVILLSTVGVRDNVVLIFLMGMCGATVLEYITGAAMERLFHVRYWDYSSQKLNLHGYICVSSSFCWGVFSVLMVRIVHVPVETAVLRLPLIVTDIISMCLTVTAAVDFTQSINEAMDVKQILMQLEESREQIVKMQESLKATAGERLEDYRTHSEKLLKDYRRQSADRLENCRKRSEELLEEYRRYSADRLEDYRRHTVSTVKKAAAERENYLKHIRKKREERRRQLADISARAETLFLENIPSQVNGLIGPKRFEELGEIKDKIAVELQKMNSRTDRRYLKAAGMLKRNPTAVSKRFREALEEIRRSMEE